MKSGAPIRPAFTVVPPAAVLGVDRKEARVAFDGRADLEGRKFARAFQSREERCSVDRSRLGHRTELHEIERKVSCSSSSTAMGATI